MVDATICWNDFMILFIGIIYSNMHKSQVNNSMNFYILHTVVTVTQINI